MQDQKFRAALKSRLSDILGLLMGLLSLSLIFMVGLAINDSRPIHLKQAGEFVAIVAACATVVTALVIHRKAQAFNESDALLKNAIDLIQKSKAVLAPNGAVTNDRISWVTCARLLVRSQAIAAQIRTSTHRDLYVAEHDYQRHVFGELLRPLGPGFFVGGTSSLSIGTISTSPAQPRNGVSWIPPGVMAAVYRFAEFPSGYEDPLSESTQLNRSELKRMLILGNRAVPRYMYFLSLFTPVGRKLFRKSDPMSGEAREATSTDIDTAIGDVDHEYLRD